MLRQFLNRIEISSYAYLNYEVNFIFRFIFVLISFFYLILFYGLIITPTYG